MTAPVADGPRRRLLLAFHPAVFLRALAAAFPGFVEGPPLGAAALYLSRPEYARLDANPLFEEAWYRRAYPQVERAIAAGRFVSGLHHWVDEGLEAGRFPSRAVQALAALRGVPGAPPDPARFDADGYLADHAEARLFVRHLPHLDALAFAATLGRWLGPPPRARAGPARAATMQPA